MTALTAAPVDVPEEPPRAAKLWTIDALFTPFSRYLAVFIIAVSFVFPVGGLGFDLCLLHNSTGLPCPGCGMSRAISAISQGDFSAAVGLNPFAFFAWPTFAMLAVLAFVGKERRERFVARVRQSKRAGKVYELIFWSFLGFGLIRFAVFLVLGEKFP